MNFITKSVNIVYKLLGSRKFATKTIYLLTFLFHFLVANYIFLLPFNLHEREEINIIEKDLNKMLDILEHLVNDNQYDNDFALIQDLIKRINIILNNDNITNDFIDKMDNDLNYLDQKYDDIFDLINLFDPIYVELKRKNHIKYVGKLREENRKKRQERKEKTKND